MKPYLRHPALCGDRIVFVTDDDLWSLDTHANRATRLTALRTAPSHPRPSPDGRWLAFLASEEGGRDVYVCPSEGGHARRLTFEGHVTSVVGWSPDGREVWFSSTARSPFIKWAWLSAVPLEGGDVRGLDLGPGVCMARHPTGPVVIGRHLDDTARWKRYRGGRKGQLWWSDDGTSGWVQAPETGGNLANPMWLDKRLWFVSDHEGTGNLYSCTAPDGPVRKETSHEGFYVRFPHTDGHRVVYGCGGDLWLHEKGDTRSLPVEVGPSAVWAQRRFFNTPRFTESIDVHPKGSSALLTVRGQSVSMDLWEGAPKRLRADTDGRRRLTRHLSDPKRIVYVSDGDGEVRLEVQDRDSGEVQRLGDLDLGIPRTLRPNPKRPLVALTNQRNELWVVDVDRGESHKVDQAEGVAIMGMDWSPDGRWLAYGRPHGRRARLCTIQLWSVEDRTTHAVTDGRSYDWNPSFDPDGHYLYFLGHRDLDPVWDQISFGYSFPRACRPWCITLQKGLTHPFRPRPRAPGAKLKAHNHDPIRVDLAGITERQVPFPIKEAVYHRVLGLPGGNALMTRQAPQGRLGPNWADDGTPPTNLQLMLWDANRRELVTAHDSITDIGLNLNRSTAWVRVGHRLRVVPSTFDKGQREEMKKSRGAKPSRSSGWLDLSRLRLSVEPQQEWPQMFREAWRLMRDHFWRADLNALDWDAVYDRYAPLVPRIRTRGELSDLIWCMQGELGTSHAYEMGGDHQPTPGWSTGHLAADWHWNGRAWAIDHVCRGEPGLSGHNSPLCEPGVSVAPKQGIVAVDGVRLTESTPPGTELVNKGGQLVRLTLGGTRRKERDVVVRTLRSPHRARYRDWVRRNRERVFEATEGRAGYLHLPDMSPAGYADFHRDYIAEIDREALLIDVRFNRGGHVSQLLLARLSSRVIGWSVPRWGRPNPYPATGILGPMVCLTNAFAGSDGDIFSHNWRTLGLGPLLGTRTWGGVVGIWPRHKLVDRTTTTQPEFSNWFEGAGFGIENHGVDPDEAIPIRPDHYARGEDPQLERGIAILKERLSEGTYGPPDFLSDSPR